MKNDFIILINETIFKNYFIDIDNTRKKIIKEKLDFLANGLWESGLRVKKLKGVSNKIVFEGRIDKGNRIIFTLGHHNNQNVLYIWGIVKHDDVSQTLYSIIPENAPFLRFKEYEQTDLSPQEYEKVLSDNNTDFFTQEDIKDIIKEDYGPQKWFVLNENEWERLLIYDKNIHDTLEMHLFLTNEQESVLCSKPPLLISGGAGSGKTTIAVYYLLSSEFINKKKIFITYNKYLKLFSEKLYERLTLLTKPNEIHDKPAFFTFKELLFLLLNKKITINNEKEIDIIEFKKLFNKHPLSKKYDSELVWEEIRAIIKGSKLKINFAQIKRIYSRILKNELFENDLYELKNNILSFKHLEFFDKIENIICKKTALKSTNQFLSTLITTKDCQSELNKLLLGEIYRIIEKKATNSDTPLLSYNEYCSLGKKRAPNFLYDRKEIYSIAEYYQGKLEEYGTWDEIDLCRSAINSIESGLIIPKYDLIVCDEIQDFTEVQLQLLFMLANNWKNIVLAGDPKQIINPSGFRWEEVKEQFYERGMEVPNLIQLDINFRSVGNIVRMANAILRIKSKILGKSSVENEEEWKYNGKPPVLVHGLTEDEVLEEIKELSSGSIILVRNKSIKEKLKQKLNTELIFTIYEAKGLEFDTVFVWKFLDSESNSSSSAIWKKIVENTQNYSHHPFIRNELNLFYVAITRARNMVIFYDGATASQIWNIQEINEHVYKENNKSLLSSAWKKVSSVTEWEEQGDYFFERDYFPAALECFKNAQNKRKIDITSAHIKMKQKHFSDAAVLFEMHGYLKEAAQNYEAAKQFKNASKLWIELNNTDQAELCNIYDMEVNGNFSKAAEEWEKRGNKEKAFENWIKDKNHLKLAMIHRSNNDLKAAAECYEKIPDLNNAAECYAMLKMYDKSYNYYYNARNYNKAAEIASILKNNTLLIDCYEKSADFYNAASLSEKLKDYANAIDFFSSFSNESKENSEKLMQEIKILENSNPNSLKLAIRYNAMKLYEKAANIFYSKKMYILAHDNFKKIKNHLMVYKTGIKLKLYSEMADYISGTNNSDKNKLIDDALKKYLFNDSYYKNSEKELKLHNEADKFLKEKQFIKALIRYKALAVYTKIYSIYLSIDLNFEAIEYFMNHLQYNYAATLIEKKKGMVLSTSEILYLQKNYCTIKHIKYRESYAAAAINCFTLIYTICTISENEFTIKSILQEFISNAMTILYLSDKNLNLDFFDLLIKSKNYNNIITIYKQLNQWNYNNEYKAQLIKVLESFCKNTDDIKMLACFYYVVKDRRFDETVKNIDFSEDIIEIFVHSSQYEKVIDYYEKSDNINKATYLYILNGKPAQAAKLFEKYNLYKNAANTFLAAKLYEDAIRCYTKINDFADVARMYEKMGKYDNAIEIWKQLNKPKNIECIVKKMNKNKQQSQSSIELFK